MSVTGALILVHVNTSIRVNMNEQYVFRVSALSDLPLPATVLIIKEELSLEFHTEHFCPPLWNQLRKVDMENA